MSLKKLPLVVLTVFHVKRVLSEGFCRGVFCREGKLSYTRAAMWNAAAVATRVYMTIESPTLIDNQWQPATLPGTRPASKNRQFERLLERRNTSIIRFLCGTNGFETRSKRRC